MEKESQEIIHTRFAHLEPALLQELRQEGTIKHLMPGEDALRTGQYIRSTVLVLNGLVKVYREDDEGNEFLMYYLVEGNACALSMMCTSKNEQSKVLAKAITDADILLLPAHLSEQWLGKYKTWYNFVISSYRERFDELLQTLDSIAFKGLDERLIFYLKRHIKLLGTEVRLSHQQIATELNTSREVISRLLKKLEQQKAIVLHRNYIEVINLNDF